jgi:hypothetical protein
MGGRRTATPRRGECNEHILLATDLLLERLIREHLDPAGLDDLLPWSNANLPLQELSQALQVPPAIVILSRLALTIKILDGGESLDAKPLAQALLLVGVDLGNGELVLLRKGKVLREGLVGGGKALAVTAPWGEELDERRLPRQRELIKVGRGQVDDLGVFVGWGRCAWAASKGCGRRQGDEE